MRSYFFALSVFFCVITTQAQVNVDFNINSNSNSSMKWVKGGTQITIEARAAIHKLWTDSIDILLDTWPDLGEVDPVMYPTMYIDCPSGLTTLGYEMNYIVYSDFGLAGIFTPDSVLVVAETSFIVPKMIAPEADLQFGITWFGHADSLPPDCTRWQKTVCFDAGYIYMTGSPWDMSR